MLWASALRLAAFAVGGVLLVAGIGTVGASGKGDDADSLGVYRAQAGSGDAQLIVYMPTDLESPSLTSNAAYLRLECFDRAGTRVLNARWPWPSITATMPGTHFHQPLSSRALAHRITRCRLRGMSRTLEATLPPGPLLPGHPKLPPDPDLAVNPL